MIYYSIVNGELGEKFDEKPVNVTFADGTSITFCEETTDEDYAQFNLFPLTVAPQEPRDQYHTYELVTSVVNGLPVAVWVATAVTITAAKTLKKREIEQNWADAVQEGSFMSANADMRVDCRRNDKDNDIQNIDGILGLLAVSAITEPVTWKGTTASKDLTAVQLQGLKIEMFGYGAAVYQRKFVALAAIEAAATIEAVLGVTF